MQKKLMKSCILQGSEVPKTSNIVDLSRVLCDLSQKISVDKEKSDLAAVYGNLGQYTVAERQAMKVWRFWEVLGC